MTSADDEDADPGDGRHESQNERMDRNWIELLQELRITQTGTQIMTGFLLTLPFQPRFASLDRLQQGLYGALVLLAAAVIVVGLAPVNLHRALFRRHLKPEVVRFGQIALRIQLAGVALIVIATVALIFDVAWGTRVALLGAGGIAILVVAAAAPPWVLGRRSQAAGRRR